MFVERDTFPGEGTVTADVQYQAPCWGARLCGAMVALAGNGQGKAGRQCRVRSSTWVHRTPNPQ